VFSIEAEGKEVWSSGPIQVESPPARLDVALGGRRDLMLKVRGSESQAHVDWVNLKASLADGRTVEISEIAAPVGDVFSFRCGGKASSALLESWRLKVEQSSERGGIVLRRITRTDPKTGLAVLCEVKEYTRFPVIEWVVRLKNASGRKSPLIEDLRSMDILARRGDFPYLHHWNGDYNAPDGYEAFRAPLAHEEEYRFAPAGGRGTDRAWPYYNLEWADSAQGLIAVVGWAGQWASRFAGARNGTVSLAAGQELTHFKLLPGEEVRTPVAVLMFYRGDRERSQNLWRRWMFAHNMPRLPEKLPASFYGANWGSEMHQADEASQLTFFDRCCEEGLQPDVWWMDAGWYPCNGNWPPTGTWEVDRERFPRGLRFINDHVHRKGTKSLVWFEPERVVRGTWLQREHPEWLLSTSKKTVEQNQLLDLGNPKAWKWLVEHFSKMIVDEGIDIYRQDFNFEPLPYWRANDAPDRQGITEIRHVEGYLAFWKELRRRFPDMLIDSCASGGRRNDLETMRLSVPLHKTDYKYDDLPTKQAFHHTLFQWIPFFAAGATGADEYSMRSAFAPGLVTGFDVRRRDLDYARLRRLVAEWRQLSEYYGGDFYPLTPFNRDEAQWIAWQFHRPEKGDGMVQVYRRAKCPTASCALSLRELDEAATYEVSMLGEAGRPVRYPGHELIESGLLVKTNEMPQALSVIYRKVE
jgi:alpha-galactosidase